MELKSVTTTRWRSNVELDCTPVNRHNTIKPWHMLKRIREVTFVISRAPISRWPLLLGSSYILLRFTCFRAIKAGSGEVKSHTYTLRRRDASIWDSSFLALLLSIFNFVLSRDLEVWQTADFPVELFRHPILRKMSSSTTTIH